MKRLITFCFLVVILPWQTAAAQETRRYFQDWLAACRTDGYCSALAYDNTDSTAGVDADYIFRVGRPAESPYWELSFTAVAAMPGLNERFDVTVDNTPFSFSPPYEAGAFGSINEFYFMNDPAQSLFDAMGPGDSLRVMFADEAGESRTATFSLRGLTAALLWIDEQQRRVGAERVTGPAPAGLTPVSASHPASIPAELLRRHLSGGECEPFEVLPHADEVIEAEIESGRIWFLPCSAGAYNFIYTVWTQQEDWLSQRFFAEYTDTLGWSGTAFLVNPDYDPQTGVLTAFYKGRGIGDCGSFGRWQWTGYSFKMLEYAYKGECDAAGGIETFPIVFSAKEESD